MYLKKLWSILQRGDVSGGKRFAWDLFIPTSSSDQQLLRLFCAREQNREAVSALPVPPPVLARGCPACNKWLHRFPQNSPPDFSRLPYLISPSDLLVTRLKDSNWWNKVSKSPITNYWPFLRFFGRCPCGGNNYQGRLGSQGDHNSQLRSTIVDVCKDPKIHALDAGGKLGTSAMVHTGVENGK